MNALPDFDANTSKAEVCAVLVTFNPDLNRLESLLKALMPQVLSVILVDNASSNDMRRWTSSLFPVSNLHLIVNEANLGIATAHNLGMEAARNIGAGYFILFDQDSSPPGNLVAALFGIHRDLERKGMKVGVVGPNYTDERNPDRPAFFQLKGFRMVPVICHDEDNVVAADFLISSGALFSMSTLSLVGGMEESLFIDHVDHEWCFRAKSLGYQSFGACKVHMSHALGEEPIRFLGRKILNHGALRHFYIFRNTIWMLKRSYVPLGWKWSMLKSIVARFLIYGLTVSPRMAYVRMMTYGIVRGIRGEMGPYAPLSSKS